MKTKAEFQQKIADSISNYPTAAQFYQARDPRLMAQLDAMATMLAMMSGEMDVQAMEPFTKARDVTVLADAAAKGILPFAIPQRVKILVENTYTEDQMFPSGRELFDPQGRNYTVDTGATIPTDDSGYIEAIQHKQVVTEHVVTESRPFYSIAVPKPSAGVYYSSIRVSNAEGDFTYKEDYTNVALAERVFHIESDENQQLIIKFGADGIAGYQPEVNEPITITAYETDGYVELEAGSKFATTYIGEFYESKLILTMDSILIPGAKPMDIATLREVTNYPSLYDSSAVFLANFDFLLRRNIQSFDFLSIWNEQREEGVRGPDVDNINTLFIAAQKFGVDQEELEEEITEIIRVADDSYKVQFVDIIENPITVNITAYVSAVYDFAAVSQKIKELVWADYGGYSAFAKRGGARILYKRLYDRLENNVPALQDAVSDLRISVTYQGNDDGELKTGKAYTRASTTVTVAFTAHGFVVGDAIIVDDAADEDLIGQQIITAVTADTFDFEDADAAGADGNLDLIAKPRPEKWRYVSDASLTVTVLQAQTNV